MYYEDEDEENIDPYEDWDDELPNQEERDLFNRDAILNK